MADREEYVYSETGIWITQWLQLSIPWRDTPKRAPFLLPLRDCIILDFIYHICSWLLVIGYWLLVIGYWAWRWGRKAWDRKALVIK